MCENKLKRFILILSFLILNSSLLIATVRYVSHSGSSTPPYTTWETAADSIQKCINICVFGDTIYVANGVYKEQVVMIPGLSLIGAGMDSCVVDSREFVTMWDDIAIEVADSCIIKGFGIIVSNNIQLGIGIAGSGSRNSLVTLNRISDVSYGFLLDATFYPIADITVYNNIFDNVRDGIEMFNSNALVRKNVIYTTDFPFSIAGIRTGAFDYSYKPIIDSNYIITSYEGIRSSFGTRPTITNNIILSEHSSYGIFLGSSDTARVYNNLIFANTGGWGIHNSGVEHLLLINNYIDVKIGQGLYIGPGNIVLNNVITTATEGVEAWNTEGLVFQYNDVWKNNSNYVGFVPDSTNISVDPMVVNDDSTKGVLDFHLQMFSPLIDAGDPDILDIDGSRSDIGIYGGPLGEKYLYQDLAPKAPRNLTAEVDSEYIALTWNRNTESDFNSYSLYRDTTAGFTIDTTKFVIELTDTFYVQIIPPGIDAFYYKLTATDNQDNTSVPSEELAVLITSVNEYPTTVSDYRLYQNYPNPFNPSTRIGYKLKERSYIKLYVYDIKGELVTTLVNQTQEAGYYEVEFSGEGLEVRGTSLAQILASGIYVYQIMIRGEGDIPVFTDIKKMILLR